VALLGGSFDPIHYGHLFAAEAAAGALGLERVLIVPSGTAPHKDASRAPAEHRLAMARLAAAGNDRLAVSDREVLRPGPSYTIDTVEAIEAETGSRVALVLGVDAFLLIRTWRRWEELLQRVDLALVSRPGYPDDEADELAAGLGVRPACRVPDLGVAVSSSALRDRIAHGLPVRYLVPDPVLHYIAERGLYRAEP
jgi:nicotinate-nucleotide adenylyltransferase